MISMKTICQSMAGLAASAVLAFGVAENASAHTLIFDESNPNLVTGIEGLDIGETEYDVEFVFESFNDVFGNTGDLSVLEGDTPTFWFDRVGAEQASRVVVEALGTTFGTESRGVSLSDNFLVPVGFLGFHINPLTGTLFESGVSFWGLGDVDGLLGIDSSSVGYLTPEVCCVLDDVFYFGPVVVFDEVTVPEPTSTIAILAVAGTGLLATRKRKK